MFASLHVITSGRREDRGKGRKLVPGVMPTKFLPVLCHPIVNPLPLTAPMSKPIVIKPVRDYTPEEWQRIVEVMKYSKGGQLTDADIEADFFDDFHKDPVVDSQTEDQRAGTDDRLQSGLTSVEDHLQNGLTSLEDQPNLTLPIVVDCLERGVRVTVRPVHTCPSCPWYGYSRESGHNCTQSWDYTQFIQSEIDRINNHNALMPGNTSKCNAALPGNTIKHNVIMPVNDTKHHNVLMSVDNLKQHNVLMSTNDIQQHNVSHPVSSQKGYSTVRTSHTPLVDRQFVCNICNSKFRRKPHLLQHITSHCSVKPYKCSYCDKRFSRHNCLEVHVRTHTGSRPYVCPLCFKSFSRGDVFRRHMRTHGDECDYVCNICGKRFKVLSYLRKHQQIHDERKPFLCTTCGREFSRKDRLMRHMRIHTDDKQYPCKLCPKQFIRKEGLQKHLLVHKRTTTYTCSICMKDYKKLGSFTKHKASHQMIDSTTDDEDDKNELGVKKETKNTEIKQEERMLTQVI